MTAFLDTDCPGGRLFDALCLQTHAGALRHRSTAKACVYFLAASRFRDRRPVNKLQSTRRRIRLQMPLVLLKRLDKLFENLDMGRFSGSAEIKLQIELS